MLRSRDVLGGFPSPVFLGPGIGGTAWLRVVTDSTPDGPVEAVYQLALHRHH